MTSEPGSRGGCYPWSRLRGALPLLSFNRKESWLYPSQSNLQSFISVSLPTVASSLSNANHKYGNVSCSPIYLLFHVWEFGIQQSERWRTRSYIVFDVVHPVSLMLKTCANCRREDADGHGIEQTNQVWQMAPINLNRVSINSTFRTFRVRPSH